jgi:hypothetical protein
MNVSLAEQQRRIHELEMQAEQSQAEQHAAPVREAPVYEAPVHEERAAPPPAPRVEEPRREQPRREEPRVNPKELLESAGLVMIETDRSKVAVQAPLAEEAQPAGRPRRERTKPPPQQDPELVQIETKR